MGRGVLKLVKQAYQLNPGYFHPFRHHPFQLLSLVRADGALDLYHGGLQARERARRDLCSTIWITGAIPSAPRAGEAVELYEVSVHQFPGIGTRLVNGPLARINNCDFIPPLAEEERREFAGVGRWSISPYDPWPITGRGSNCCTPPGGNQGTAARPGYLRRRAVVCNGETREGIGVIEAPRVRCFTITVSTRIS